MSFDILAWIIIAFWIGFRLLLIVAQPKVAFSLAAIVAFFSLVLPSIMPLMVAILAPFGFLLPALALRDITGRMWVEIPPFQTPDVVVVLIASTLFIAASIGVFPVDPYRLGYSPEVPAIVSLASIFWALWRQQYFILGSVLVAQLIWSLGYWSPNFFDLILHAILAPICAIWLIERILARVSRDLRPVDQGL